MPKKKLPHKSFEFTIDNNNIEFIIEKVFEDNPEMIKKLKAKLHQSGDIKSNKPPFFL